MEFKCKIFQEVLSTNRKLHSPPAFEFPQLRWMKSEVHDREILSDVQQLTGTVDSVRSGQNDESHCVREDDPPEKNVREFAA